MSKDEKPKKPYHLLKHNAQILVSSVRLLIKAMKNNKLSLSQALILNEILHQGPGFTDTKTSLTRKLGLHERTVLRAINELIDEGWIKEIGEGWPTKIKNPPYKVVLHFYEIGPTIKQELGLTEGEQPQEPQPEPNNVVQLKSSKKPDKPPELSEAERAAVEKFYNELEEFNS
jgi:DNA-binding Lrp family transcriptional regulator